MHKLLFSIAIAGLLVSGYLFITYTSPLELICTNDGGCHTVQLSQYSSFFGIPTPAYGIVFYTTVAILASLWKGFSKNLYWLMLLVTSIGFAVSVFLTYLEAFVIEAWCFWCVISAVLSTLAYMIVLLQYKDRYGSIR